MKYINDQIFSIDKSRYYIKDGNDKGEFFVKKVHLLNIILYFLQNKFFHLIHL